MISNCGHDENNKYSGGKAGDQTGGEWAIIEWYSRPWRCILRHPDKKVREKIAELARAAALNNMIGYDQYQRHTFWIALKEAGYDPTKIKYPCEADCSSGYAAIVKAVGYILSIKKLQEFSTDAYTGNLRSCAVAAGFEVLTENKYLTSDKYLLPGDGLLYDNHHVATNLDTGSKVGGTTEKQTGTDNVAKGQAWLNSNYGALIKKATGKLLTADNDYGTHSRKAALAVWKDVVNRKYGFSLTPSNANFGASCKAAAAEATVRKGNTGTLVYLVEFILSAKGYYIGKMDAIFGDGLYATVVAWQHDNGLEQDSVVGPESWYKLFN